MSDKPVSIYTTPTCQYCKATKEFFKENNVAYTEYNVQTDVVRRQEMIEKSGQMGVPVIFVGTDMVIGYDQVRLKELLGLGA